MPVVTLEPATQKELAEALKDANERGCAVIPRGGGTKSGWGNPPSRADAVISTTRLNQVEEHAWADLTVTVQAGCTLAHVQKTLSERGQRLAVDALWPEQATIGGVLSTNDTGALRLSFGGLRDLIIGVTLALADGTLAESGGKVVKNVAGYDLPKLVTGALGTLGVITRAVFRVHPLPHHSRTLTAIFADMDTAQKFVLSVQDSNLAHTSLQVRIASEGKPAADILLEGTEAGIAAQDAAARKLAEHVTMEESGAQVWNSRQDLWTESGAIAKFSALPTHLTKIVSGIARVSSNQAEFSWNIVAQANGLGFVRIADGVSEGDLLVLRHSVEHLGGSLVLLRKPEGVSVDAWGAAGNALPLMKALKLQFDPKNTLNPGRYVGGI